MTRHNNSIPHFKVKNINVTPSTIIEWNNLDSNIRNSESLVLIKKRIFAFIRPSALSTFHNHEHKGLNYLQN